MELWGPESDFDNYCIDFERGDAKPQVRVHGSAAFNITNFAQFENIEFVGIDNLAVPVETDVPAQNTVYLDAFNYVPF